MKGYGLKRVAYEGGWSVYNGSNGFASDGGHCGCPGQVRRPRHDGAAKRADALPAGRAAT